MYTHIFKFFYFIFGELAQFGDSSGEFMEQCQTVNMLFFLGIILGIIGIILLTVGLVKRKE